MYFTNILVVHVVSNNYSAACCDNTDLDRAPAAEITPYIAQSTQRLPTPSTVRKTSRDFIIINLIQCCLIVALSK